MKQKIVDKAKKFVVYVNDDYNEGRDIIAVLGSFGITFTDDIEELLNGLNHIGEYELEKRIRDCFNTVRKAASDELAKPTT